MWQSFFALEVVPYFMTLPEVSEYKPLWHIFPHTELKFLSLHQRTPWNMAVQSGHANTAEFLQMLQVSISCCFLFPGPSQFPVTFSANSELNYIVPSPAEYI